MTRPQSFRSSNGEELTAALIEKINQRRQVDADILELLGIMDREQVAGDAGYPSLAMYVVHATRMSRGSASRLVGQAQQITETLTPTGHVTPAPLPQVRELVRDAVVDGEHVDAIVRTMAKLPESTPAEVREIVETTLADTARTSDPIVVRRHGLTLLQRINADGPAPDDQQPQVRNELHLQRTSDGGVKFRGRLTKKPAEELISLLAAHTLPQSPVPGVPDPRSEAERQGDGLEAIVHLGIGSGANPVRGGAKPHVNLLVDLNRFMDGSGIATTDSGSVLCPESVRLIACDADIVRIVLDKQGAPVNVGYAHRVVTSRQRQALVARDKGCAFPGCHLPAQWTDAHHVIHWKDGGRTDLPNLVLLCRRHHTLLHHSEWIIRMVDDVPWFRPPCWVDPQQTLLRNILRQ